MSNKEKKLPTSLGKAPVLQAIVEMRFTPNRPAGAVVGAIYEKFKSEYPDMVSLPIMQMPEPVRLNDPNLAYQPTHSFPKERYLLQVGPRVITLIVNPGGSEFKWAEFFENVKKIVGGIREIELVGSLERIGVRYINFFKEDIADKIELDVKFTRPVENFFFGGEVVKDSLRSRLQVSNNSDVNGEKGSIIDIDTFAESDLQEKFDETETIIDNAHKLTKEIFYETLKEDFVKTLEPVYE